MEMEHALSRAGTDVVDRPVSIFDLALARELRRDQLAVAEDLRVLRLGFLQSDHVFFGDDQHVRGRLRIDVLEGEGSLVFVDLLRGDLAGDDLAEQTVAHGGDSNAAGGTQTEGREE